MHSLLAPPLGLLSLLLLAAPVRPSPVCDTLRQTSPSINISAPLSPSYNASQAEYWSTAASALQPSCIVFPRTADEVALVIRALGNATEPFAIKSGGHNPNNFPGVYFSSVAGGPVVSTASLTAVVLDRDAQTVTVGPGNRWDGVAAALDGTGYAAVGGRMGNVGVGGLLLGGGLSFLSSLHGWASTSILSFELVLANATIVNVTATSHPDLFIALRGGGNAFGIVTSFTLRAYPQPLQIWGGSIMLGASPETDAALLAAVANFTTGSPDPAAAIIPTTQRLAGGQMNLWTVFLFYNGPTPPAGLFDAFLNAGEVLGNTCKTRSYKDLLVANNEFVISGTVYTMGTETIPLPDSRDNATAGTLKAMQAVHAHWWNVSGTYANVTGMLSVLTFQPVPRGMASLSVANGGDLIDLDDNTDRIMIELTHSFSAQEDVPRGDAAMQETYGGIKQIVDRMIGDGELPDAYRPLFMNDAYFRQDFAGRLRPERKALAERVKKEVDPAGLWGDRTGGFIKL